jgi:hypothetical protein
MSQTVTATPDQERYSRRLSDKIQAAFDHACEENELTVAADLLVTLELVLLRIAPRPDRREAIVAPLMASHERLWHLRATEQAKTADQAGANADAPAGEPDAGETVPHA